MDSKNWFRRRLRSPSLSIRKLPRFTESSCLSLILRLGLQKLSPTSQQFMIPFKLQERLTSWREKSNAGLIVLPSAQFTTARELIIATAARLRLPTMYAYTFWVRSGGLISYGFDAQDMYRRAASTWIASSGVPECKNCLYRIPVKFELAINLKTAKALGLDVPPTLLARADEVIE
jgi:putative tryptophan/tyrosine transport system substrate-binding protein